MHFKICSFNLKIRKIFLEEILFFKPISCHPINKNLFYLLVSFVTHLQEKVIEKIFLHKISCIYESYEKPKWSTDVLMMLI